MEFAPGHTAGRWWGGDLNLLCLSQETVLNHRATGLSRELCFVARDGRGDSHNTPVFRLHLFALMRSLSGGSLWPARWDVMTVTERALSKEQ